jgi:hypothetical protein
LHMPAAPAIHAGAPHFHQEIFLLKGLSYIPLPIARGP